MTSQGPLRIGIGQIAPIVGDLEGNVARAVDAVERATATGADLVVLPELAVPGCPPRDILRDASFTAAVEEATRDLAARIASRAPTLVGTVLPSGTSRRDHPALWNAAALLRGGSVEAVVPKRLLPSYDVFHEGRWFLPGPGPTPPLDIGGRRVGVLVCEDLWGDGGPVDPVADLIAGGSEIVVALTASPFRRGIGRQRLEVAGRTDRPTVVVNLVGATDELIFDGRSFALDGAAPPVVLSAFEPEVRVVELGRGGAQGDSVRGAPDSVDSFDEGPADVFAALCLGLRDFVDRNRVSRVVLGLSGGIDSALVAILACEALGPERVAALALPSRYTDPRSTSSARVLAEELGISFDVVPIDELHRTAEAVLGPLRDVAAENLQARLRMLALTARVDATGSMLLGTANETEMALGYTTLYGDLAGTVLPLGDLTKTEVVELAHWWNDRHGAIPPFVLERPPSAELRPAQIDPFEYDVVAPHMEGLVRADRSDERMRRSEHKRWQAGIVLRVSERAFGTGRLIPVTRR